MSVRPDRRPPPRCMRPASAAVAGRAAARRTSRRAPKRRAPRCSARWPSASAPCRPAASRSARPAKRMQEYLGLSGPAAGFMAAGDLHRSGADAAASPTSSAPAWSASWRCGWRATCRPARARRSRPPRRSATLFAGIEIVENRYGDLRRARHADADRRPGVSTPRRCWAILARRTGARSTSARCAAGMIVDGHQRDEGRGRRPDGASDELPGLARGFVGGGGVRRAEGGPGGHAGQRDAADLADRPGQRHRRLLAAAAGAGAAGLIPFVRLMFH